MVVPPFENIFNQPLMPCSSQDSLPQPPGSPLERSPSVLAKCTLRTEAVRRNPRKRSGLWGRFAVRIYTPPKGDSRLSLTSDFCSQGSAQPLRTPGTSVPSKMAWRQVGPDIVQWRFGASVKFPAGQEKPPVFWVFYCGRTASLRRIRVTDAFSEGGVMAPCYQPSPARTTRRTGLADAGRS